jgi:hypothetical protein
MLFNVVPICRQGVRLARASLRAAEPILGRLVVEDWREGNAERRALRVARLRHPTQDYFPELLPPLFDPVLIRSDQRGMVLCGFECEPRGNGESAMVMQAWWLRAVAKDTPGDR